MKRIYVIPLGPHAGVGVDVGSICWGSCGKGLMGGIDLGEYGGAIPCDEEDCPYLDKQMDAPLGEAEYNGHQYELVLRKLRAARVTEEG